MIAEKDIDNTTAIFSIEVRAITKTNHEPLHLQNLRKAADDDPQYPKLKRYTLHGFPKHCRQLPNNCRCYRKQSYPLWMSPLDTHQNNFMTHTKVWKKEQDWWYIGQAWTVTSITSALLSNHWEPIMCKAQPTRPFQAITADFCSYAGLITVVWHCTNDQQQHHSTTDFSPQSCCTGVPGQSRDTFYLPRVHLSMGLWAYYLQINDKAEAAVKSIIQTVRNGRHLDENKLIRALLQYRNAPSCNDGQSPAQKLYGHRIQDTLTAHRFRVAT